MIYSEIEFSYNFYFSLCENSSLKYNDSMEFVYIYYYFIKYLKQSLPSDYISMTKTTKTEDHLVWTAENKDPMHEMLYPAGYSVHGNKIKKTRE